MIDNITLKTKIMTKDFTIGLVPNEVYKVEQFGNTFKLVDTQGTKVGALGTTSLRKVCFQRR
jgi:hypothetical protein